MKTTSTLKISAVKTILRNTFLAVVVLPVAPAVAANNCHVYEVSIRGGRRPSARAGPHWHLKSSPLSSTRLGARPALMATHSSSC